MPKKNKSQTQEVDPTPQKIDSFASMAQELHLHESYKSLLLGLAVVLLAGVLTVGYLKNRNAHQMKPANTQMTAMKAEKKEEVLGTHIVASGDDLKTISTQYYETPDLFLLIAKRNGITNPDAIDEGKNLVIPKVDKKQLVASLMYPTAQTTAITGTSYTVQDKDLLWDIAVRAYGDGNKWKEIMQANNLPSSDAIFSGMILQLPR